MFITSDRIRPFSRAWLLAAVGEIVLIFIGITLAITFENWNSRRNEREQERRTLVELRSNLAENLDKLRSNLATNSRLLARIDTVLEHLDARRQYSDDLSTAFGGLDNWASPFLSSGAYETLKGRGLDLITDAALRSKVVSLFESVYATLVDDWDRAEWINYEVSMAPMMLAHVEELSTNKGQPIDYRALVENRSFRSALRRSAALRNVGITLTRGAIEATEQVIALLDVKLNDRVKPAAER